MNFFFHFRKKGPKRHFFRNFRIFSNFDLFVIFNKFKRKWYHFGVCKGIKCSFYLIVSHKIAFTIHFLVYISHKRFFSKFLIFWKFKIFEKYAKLSWKFQKIKNLEKPFVAYHPRHTPGNSMVLFSMGEESKRNFLKFCISWL